MDKISVTRATPQEIQKLGATQWPIWTCGVSTFDWHYDEPETCVILEGQVTVKSANQQVQFSAGDLVVFPRGMDCTWCVTAPVKKHYKFG